MEIGTTFSAGNKKSLLSGCLSACTEWIKCIESPSGLENVTGSCLRAFPGKNTWGGPNSVNNWGTTTRILIIFGVPPHKYKYFK